MVRYLEVYFLKAKRSLQDTKNLFLLVLVFEEQLAALREVKNHDHREAGDGGVPLIRAAGVPNQFCSTSRQ